MPQGSSGLKAIWFQTMLLMESRDCLLPWFLFFKLTLQVSITAHDCYLIRFVSKLLTSCTTQDIGHLPWKLTAGRGMVWAQNRYPTCKHWTGLSHSILMSAETI